MATVIIAEAEASLPPKRSSHTMVYEDTTSVLETKVSPSVDRSCCPVILLTTAGMLATSEPVDVPVNRRSCPAVHRETLIVMGAAAPPQVIFGGYSIFLCW